MPFRAQFLVLYSYFLHPLSDFGENYIADILFMLWARRQAQGPGKHSVGQVWAVPG